MSFRRACPFGLAPLKLCEGAVRRAFASNWLLNLVISAFSFLNSLSDCCLNVFNSSLFALVRESRTKAKGHPHFFSLYYAHGFIVVSTFLLLKYSIISALVIFDNFSLNLSLCCRINFTASNCFSVVFIISKFSW